MNKKRLLLLGVVVFLVSAFFALDLPHYLSLEYFKSRQLRIAELLGAHPFYTGGAYFLTYIAVTALSLPGATLMTLAGGALFGLGWGLLLVSFASSIGATLAFLVARFVLFEPVQRCLGKRLKAINRGVVHDGGFYLFTLRLVPIFPFFVVNLVMALTPIRLLTFYWVSQLGMLPATLVYVNAGTQIAQIHSLSGITSPGLIGAFVLLGLFPLAARKVLEVMQGRRVLRGHKKPRRFDCNLVVIGAGSAGLVAAYIAAAIRARVTLIEKHRMGGDCLNTGCVPSKALIRSARVTYLASRARELGFRSIRTEFRFAEVMERVQRVIRAVEPHDSAERYTKLGVDVVHGEARITSPWTVAVDGREIRTRAIVVAAGARALVPPIPGLETLDYLTSETVWELRERPAHLAVLGGGPVGCELAQALSRLGCRVTLVELAPRLLLREDPEIAERVAGQFRGEGIDLRLGCTATAVRPTGAGGGVLVCRKDHAELEIPFDRLLLALGRRPNVEGYGLEEVGVTLASDRTLEVNEFLQTSIPTIYACGDIASPYQFTHTAAHQAWYATVNALFGGLKRFRADYSVIPWATFTDPEVARVGLNETEARLQGVDYEVTRYDLAELDRAIVEEAACGVIKVLTVPGRDRILGATIVGEHAGELITEFVLAMRHGLGLNKLLSTIHVYPTLMEANKYAAGAWKRAHAPQRALAWLERFHAWRRREPGSPGPRADP